jgi:nucleoside-diphosphate-sugar epimerase/putative sterol carrier protein
MRYTAPEPPSFFLTGATGFLGHHILHELLAAGARVTALVRPPVEASRARLASLLLSLSPGAGISAWENLHLIEGSLAGGWDDRGQRFDAVIHAAAVTRFGADGTGEPFRTNVDGTERLLAWMEARGIRSLHLVGTAYACGRTAGVVPEAALVSRPEFRNDYEESKWMTESSARSWAIQTDGTLTVLRPSIIVGAHATGRATRFHGFYLSARACEAVSRIARRNQPASAIPSISLRLAGRKSDTQDLVPVDWVARMVAGIALDPDLHGGVYHLTHPAPPDNRAIGGLMESFFGFRGVEFIGRNDVGHRDELEEAFQEVGGAIEQYLAETPHFARVRTEAAERRLGLPCPSWNDAALRRLLVHARNAGWGRRRGPDRDGAACEAYFQRFLPPHIARSSVARMHQLTATVRFVIEDVPDGQWVCRFDRGALAHVQRGANGVREDFSYRVSESAFWDVVSGRIDPPQLFLSGQAEIEGDFEKALKLATIFSAFTREFPADATIVVNGGARECA